LSTRSLIFRSGRQKEGRKKEKKGGRKKEKKHPSTTERGPIRASGSCASLFFLPAASKRRGSGRRKKRKRNVVCMLGKEHVPSVKEKKGKGKGREGEMDMSGVPKSLSYNAGGEAGGEGRKKKGKGGRTLWCVGFPRGRKKKGGTDTLQ